MKTHFSITILVLCFALMLSGCFLLNPIPKEYTEGIKVPREYPDDDLEIYDDATVFEVDKDDEEISLTYGTEDDIDDVIDYYEDLFDDNDLTIEEKEDDKDEFYAKGRGDGFTFEIEAEEARGEIEEKLFETVVKVNVEFVEPEPTISIDVPVVTEAPIVTPTPKPDIEPTPTSNDSGYDPDWDKDYVYYYIDATTLGGDELAAYISDVTWYFLYFEDSEGVHNGDTGQIVFYSDGTLEDTFNGDTMTGTWNITGSQLNFSYANGISASFDIYFQFSGSTANFIIHGEEEGGFYAMYSLSPPGSITMYYTAEDLTAAAYDRTFDSLYYLYYDGSIESMLPSTMTFFDGFFEGIFEGLLHTGDWDFSDGYLEASYYGAGNSGGVISSYAIIEYNSANDKYYLFISDDEVGFEDCYWVYVSR